MQSSSPALLFRRLRLQLLRNSLRAMMERSQLRFVTIILCSLIIWAFLFAVSWKGFHELRVTWDVMLNGKLLALVFDFLFFALTLLLTFSTAIILYSSLFSSAESWFLLSGPMAEDQIFAYKFQGAVAFSSWAFVLLGSPIVLAYGLEVEGGAPWYFYGAMPLFFLGFILLPGSLGALAALLFVNFLPRQGKQIVFVIATGLAGLVGFWFFTTFREAMAIQFGTHAWLDFILGELTALRQRLVPVQWTTLGIMAAAVGDVETMFYYLVLVWSNGLILYLATVWLARVLFRRGFNRVATGGTLRKRYGGAWLDNTVNRLLFFLDPQTRLLIIKDFKTFRREPAQWLQILIFLGLGVLYFSNMRRFYEKDIGRPFQNGISLLTLTATGFLMCAYTGRFIFPMLSLEGRKFWILGLLPLERERLIWGKFAFASTGSIVFAEFLVLFSDWALTMPWTIMAVHALVVATLAFGLSGLSVGLGACLPNLRESDPSKIAVSFGGTLNLIAGLFFLVIVISAMAAPFHLALAGNDFEDLGYPWWLAFFLIFGLAAGAAAVILPLRAGARTLRSMEF